MKKFLALSIVAVFLFVTAGVAQEKPGKKKVKAATEQKANPEQKVEPEKGKSEAAKAEHKKMKKGKKQKENDDRVPSVIRDRNIP